MTSVQIISIFRGKKQLGADSYPKKIDRRIALVSYRPSPWLNRIVFDFRNRSRKYSSQGISRDERCAASGDVISKNVQLRLGDGRRPLPSRSSSNVPVNSEQSGTRLLSREFTSNITKSESNLDNFLFNFTFNQFYFSY